MSRAQGNKLYNDFSRGLITEASYLAFPENATIDEINCDIQENGIRVRRYGFNTHGTFDTLAGTFDTNDIFQEFVWRSVNKEGETSFLVVQHTHTLHFYRINGSSNLSVLPFTLDLRTHQIGTDLQTQTNRCQFASGKGNLYVAHPYLKPLLIEYDSVGNNITANEITIKIRDFIGVDDGLAIDEEPSVLSDTHHYNLRNQGWINPELAPTGSVVQTVDGYGLFGERFPRQQAVTTGPIASYFGSFNKYPGNNKIWWSSKNTEGDFDPAGLNKIFFGNTRSPRGHYIVDAFNIDRTAVSGVANLPVVSSDTRPRTVVFNSGRVFWAHESEIYFSPILDDGSRAGQCFQEADPTSEDISDLIATDGGVIPLPESEDIIRMVDIGNGIAVFARNGVWFIASGSQGFTALDYSITKISDIGTVNQEAIVRAGSKVFWWSDTGIQAMQQSIGQFGPINGQFDQTNITDETIQTLYNNIDLDTKKGVKGYFDPASSKVYWMYQDSNDGLSELQNLLQLDLTLSAFVPWKVVKIANPCYMVGGFRSTFFATGTEDTSFIEFLCRTPAGIQLANFVDTDYVDWASVEEQTYESRIITGYETLEDGLRRKQAPIVGIFFRRTEDGVTDNGDGSYTIDNESSCYFQTRWNWSNQDVGKWSNEVQAYRPRATAFVDPSAPSANPGVDVVYTRNKVRGSGRSVQFRFSESEKGKGFELLGWHVFFQSKTTA